MAKAVTKKFINDTPGRPCIPFAGERGPVGIGTVHLADERVDSRNIIIAEGIEMMQGILVYAKAVFIEHYKQGCCGGAKLRRHGITGQVEGIVGKGN